MYWPQFGQTTCGWIILLQFGQATVWTGFLKSWERREPVRALLCFLLGTAILNLPKSNSLKLENGATCRTARRILVKFTTFNLTRTRACNIPSAGLPETSKNANRRRRSRLNRNIFLVMIRERTVSSTAAPAISLNFFTKIRVYNDRTGWKIGNVEKLICKKPRWADPFARFRALNQQMFVRDFRSSLNG